MIVSLTPNTTLDVTVFVPKLVANKTIRATRTVHSMGGKPTDAAWILGRMGVENLALGLAAGAVGDKVQSMLEALGVTTDFVPADGETRINSVIIDESSGDHTTITTATMQVQPAHISELLRRYALALEKATVVITGGSLPPGMNPDFYVEPIEMAREAGVTVIFDASQPVLGACLAAKPAFIKPNKDELSALMGRSLATVDELHAAGKEILQRYGTQSVITMGGDGALAVLQNATYRIPPIEVEVSSPAGAGDAVLAGLAHALHFGTEIEAGLRLGIAAATAVCLQAGTAAYEVADMRRFLPLVELIAYP